MTKRMQPAKPDQKDRPISFCALPDRAEVLVRVQENGQPTAIIPNRISVPYPLRDQLPQITQALWHPMSKSYKRQTAPWIINQCADADEYRDALIWLDRAYGDTTPIFNHPRAVAMTRRDLSAGALQGVEGLIVPRCARFIATSRTAFERCFEQGGFQFPVLVRPCRGQTGIGLQRINSAAQWDLAVNTQWFGQAHFMTEFVDFESPDGNFLKARVLFVGDNHFVRHIKAGDSWKVHNETSDRHGTFKERELDLVSQLNANAVFNRACAAVPARTSIDFCGMDVGIDLAQNRFVMFECNAAMSVFFRGDGRDRSAERVARDKLLQRPAADRFEAHFNDPDAWLWRKHQQQGHADFPECRALLAD
jgi:glutathione synthase/RimK-type ligase-like ATP-grasp enzyme